MEITVRGRKVRWNVHEKTGVFTAEVNGQDYKADTLAQLKAALERDLKKKPLNIPFVEVDEEWRGDWRVQTGIITGKHSSNGNLLVRYDGDKSSSQYSHWRGNLLVAGTDVEELKRLKKAADDAQKAYDKFLEKHRIDASKIGVDEKEDGDGTSEV